MTTKEKTTPTRKVRPIGPRVLVARKQDDERSRGGIIIPDTAKQKPNEGEVIALGTGKVLENGTIEYPLVKVGDVVLWGRFGGNELKVDGEDIFAIHQDEIIAVVEES
jgi:chaperonin GroES